MFTEAAYKGNIGVMELAHFHRVATPDQKVQLKDHIRNNKQKDAWELVQTVTGKKLHNSAMAPADRRNINNTSSMGEIYDPHLKVSKYQWGEKEGVEKMKRMTPGEKMKIKEQKIPRLLMSPAQIANLTEEANQLEFDGIQTKNFDICKSAYTNFKQMIETIRSGKHIGELTGHTTDTVRQVQAGTAMKPKTLSAMQYKQYTGL